MIIQSTIINLLSIYCKNVFFFAIRSCIETAIWTFNLLATREVHYMEKIPEMIFAKKLNVFTTEEKRH